MKAGNAPSTTVSQAEWWETPMEFPARQVYSPESFRDTFLSVRTSMSLSVVFKPAVWMEREGEKSATLV